MANVRRITLTVAVVLLVAGIRSEAQSSQDATQGGGQDNNSQTSSSSSSPSGATSQPATPYVSPSGAGQLGHAGGGGEKGVTYYEFYGGSATGSGYITTLESTLGYNFNQYFGIDVGVPVYFIGASANKPLRTPAGLALPTSFSETGVGDVFVDLMYTRMNPTLNYLSSVRLGAPTGSLRDGLTTGHVTFDWDNYVDRDFGRLRPYVDVGFANSILDTHYLYRPYTTYGYVVHSEAGASVEVVSPLRVGASFYDDAPIGPQTVFRRPGGLEVRGPASIDRDDGASVFATISPISVVLIEVGYDHSFVYDVNSFSFGLSFNVAGAIRKLRAAH